MLRRWPRRTGNLALDVEGARGLRDLDRCDGLRGCGQPALAWIVRAAAEAHEPHGADSVAVLLNFAGAAFSSAPRWPVAHAAQHRSDQGHPGHRPRLQTSCSSRSPDVGAARCHPGRSTHAGQGGRPLLEGVQDLPLTRWSHLARRSMASGGRRRSGSQATTITIGTATFMSFCGARTVPRE